MKPIKFSNTIEIGCGCYNLRDFICLEIFEFPTDRDLGILVLFDASKYRENNPTSDIVFQIVAGWETIKQKREEFKAQYRRSK